MQGRPFCSAPPTLTVCRLDYKISRILGLPGICKCPPPFVMPSVIFAENLSVGKWYVDTKILDPQGLHETGSKNSTTWMIGANVLTWEPAERSCCFLGDEEEEGSLLSLCLALLRLPFFFLVTIFFTPESGPWIYQQTCSTSDTIWCVCINWCYFVIGLISSVFQQIINNVNSLFLLNVSFYWCHVVVNKWINE